MLKELEARILELEDDSEISLFYSTDGDITDVTMFISTGTCSTMLFFEKTRGLKIFYCFLDMILQEERGEDGHNTQPLEEPALERPPVKLKAELLDDGRIFLTFFPYIKPEKEVEWFQIRDDMWFEIGMRLTRQETETLRDYVKEFVGIMEELEIENIKFDLKVSPEIKRNRRYDD